MGMKIGIGQGILQALIKIIGQLKLPENEVAQNMLNGSLDQKTDGIYFSNHFIFLLQADFTVCGQVCAMCLTSLSVVFIDNIYHPDHLSSNTFLFYCIAKVFYLVGLNSLFLLNHFVFRAREPFTCQCYFERTI